MNDTSRDAAFLIRNCIAIPVTMLIGVKAGIFLCWLTGLGPWLFGL